MAKDPSLSQDVAELAKTFGGQLLQPADAGYEEARKIHNGLVDKHPGLIARCKGTADIVDAVNLGRKLGLAIAVRGGGHNVAGRATVDKGLMIDLSPMKGIHIDVKARTARVQGGVNWAEFNREMPAAWVGHDGRRGLLNRRRRAHAWRRTWLAHGKAWHGPRQSAFR